MQDTELIEARLRDASTLPEMLAAGFDAFEVIRRGARGYVDTVPGLFAAFMTTAREAVEGREAITAAPSLPPGPAAIPAGLPTADAKADEVMTTLARLAVLVAGSFPGSLNRVTGRRPRSVRGSRSRSAAGPPADGP